MSLLILDSGWKHPGGLLRVAAVLAVVVCLTGCVPKKKLDIPVFKEEPPAQAQPAQPAATAPTQPQPEPERQLEPAPKAAPEIPPTSEIPPPPGQTGSLLASANKAMQAGELDKAEMHLERALRLSPREAQLWYTMAKVRFEQGNYAQAVQFCLKSNSLAGKNNAVIRQNWLLMEKAYLKTGEKEKAAQARQKAGE